MADVDLRLLSTAEDIGSGIERNLASWPFSTEPVRFEDIVPTLGSFASRGQLIQITSPNGEVVRTSEYAPSKPIVPETGAPSGEPEIVSTELAGAMRLAPFHYPVTVTDRDGVRWYIGAVVVGERLTTMHETLASLRQVLLVASALRLALALAGGWVLAGRVLQPVDRRHRRRGRSPLAMDGDALSSRLVVPPTDDELSASPRPSTPCSTVCRRRFGLKNASSAMRHTSCDTAHRDPGQCRRAAPPVAPRRP